MNSKQLGPAVNQVIKNRLNFVITSTPTDSNIGIYVSYIKNNNITNMVRACESAYDESSIQKICEIKPIVFNDGKFPSNEQVFEWIDYIYNVFYKCDNQNKILIHCVAGLGRAPLLVGIALIVCESMDPFQAIDLLRTTVKQCLNNKQINYLADTNWSVYRKKFKRYSKKNSSIKNIGECQIM
jgi:protein tyrosine phosphatase type 4A